VKHLVDVDEQALAAARAELGTVTIKDTINAALRRIGGERAATASAAVETLAAADWVDREAAWR
jgi:Arc/MetJ family transcription regulator